MFSALKKLVGSEQAPGRDKNIPAGLQSMNQALQRRFAKGVQYNSEYGPVRRGKWEGPGPGYWDLAEAGSCPGPGSVGGLVTPRGLAVCGEMVAGAVGLFQDVLSPDLCTLRVL